MTIRMVAVVASTAAVLLAGTACAPSPQPDDVPVRDLESWVSETLPAPTDDGFSVAGTTSSDGGSATSTVSDVPPGWYAVTLACAPTGSGAGPARMTLSGAHGTYGGGDCAVSPVTTTVRFGDSADARPESITVTGEADDGEVFWGASVSPTTAPER
ncbi:hypothetical protein [Kocuria sp. NPDC057446]|uniref:hypothetical protein n=1 Tax=Kocuria sp. NPDC057446 TaxID=3346137 RepID=UPI00369E11B0